jgi:hypothetical protein
MSPVTHLFASWLIAARTTDNHRDCRLVAFSGLAPDLDGLGIVADFARHAMHRSDDYFYYQKFHHTLLHGVLGAAVIAVVLCCFAERRWRVLAWCFVVAHLHFLCDLVGSRGPGVEDNWPIHYLLPFTRDWAFSWSHQWALNAWPNRVISIALMAACLCVPLKLGDSVVGVFNLRADQVFVSVLRRWRERWLVRGRRGSE